MSGLSGGIEAAIEAATGRAFPIENRRPMGGGCINAAEVVEGNGQRYFVKRNSARHLDMFTAEADGLNEIAVTKTVRVPSPVAYGLDGGEAFLVLEFLDMGGRDSGAKLGRQLAGLHRHTVQKFGWKRDNTIGATPQENNWTDGWIDFLREHRLGFQLSLARQNGYGGDLQRQGEVLLGRLSDFFYGYQPVPSLLHGDLWGGNAATLASGEPVIFDPAVYYGDREADLAMTELFGGFSGDFYAGYREAWPLDAGYGVRKVLYNLYHILNHANLFGGGYASQATSMMGRLLAEIRG